MTTFANIRAHSTAAADDRKSSSIQDLDVPDLWLRVRRSRRAARRGNRARHALGRPADELDLSRMRRPQGRFRDGGNLENFRAMKSSNPPAALKYGWEHVLDQPDASLPDRHAQHGRSVLLEDPHLYLRAQRSGRARPGGESPDRHDAAGAVRATVAHTAPGRPRGRADLLRRAGADRPR